MSKYMPHRRSIIVDLFAATILLSFTLPAVAQPAPPPAPPANPIRVASGVISANLVDKVSPHYPSQAKAGRVQGAVEVEIIIGTDGSVESAVASSGPAELVQAAEEAVAQWQYRPTILNGDPVRVISTVTVTFILN